MFCGVLSKASGLRVQFSYKEWESVAIDEEMMKPVKDRRVLGRDFNVFPGAPSCRYYWWDRA